MCHYRGNPGSLATSVAARLDRIPPFRLHRRMGIAVGFACFFDLYDIFLGGVLAAVLAEEWDLGTSGKALVISSGFAGMFFGAIVLGTLADRLGRRRMFLLNLASTRRSASPRRSRPRSAGWRCCASAAASGSAAS